MKNWGEKIICVLILIAILAPSAYLLTPVPTAHADDPTSCVGGVITAFVEGLLGNLVATVMSVPVNDVGNALTHTTNAGFDAGTWIKNCIIIPLIKNLVKMLIHQFLTSIVDWINSGFNGTPRFVGDPASFFASIADQAIGQTIYGTDLNFLCSPFKVNVRIALGLSNWPRREQLQCTLSQIAQNVQGFWLNGTQVGVTGGAPSTGAWNNGWENWINLTTVPQNNIYGSYSQSQAIIDSKISRTKNSLTMELNFGSGFLNTKRCMTGTWYADNASTGSSQPIDPFTASDQDLAAATYICDRYQTVTPGATIKDGLSKAFGSQIDEYVNADDFNAIIGALTNQMFGQIFSNTGIFGAQGVGSGTTYQQRFATDITNGAFGQVPSSLPKDANGVTLDGAFCSPTLPTKAVSGQTPIPNPYYQTQFVVQNNTVYWWDPSTQPPTLKLATAMGLSTLTNGLATPAPFAWTPTLLQQAKLFCSADPFAKQLALLADPTLNINNSAYSSYLQQISQQQQNNQAKVVQLSQNSGATAIESSVYAYTNDNIFYQFPANLAVDGNSTGAGGNGVIGTIAIAALNPNADQNPNANAAAKTTLNSMPWWQIDLPTETSIRKVEIYVANLAGITQSFSARSIINFYDNTAVTPNSIDGDSGVPPVDSQSLSGKGGGGQTVIIFPQTQKPIRRITIFGENYAVSLLQLLEVKVYRNVPPTVKLAGISSMNISVTTPITPYTEPGLTIIDQDGNTYGDATNITHFTSCDPTPSVAGACQSQIHPNNGTNSSLIVTWPWPANAQGIDTSTDKTYSLQYSITDPVSGLTSSIISRRVVVGSGSTAITTLVGTPSTGGTGGTQTTPQGFPTTPLPTPATP